MMVPTDVWLTVVSYRDFYDIPRLILVADQQSKCWMLDCSFDDDRDEYSTSYNTYFVGYESDQAQAIFERHAKGATGEVVGIVPVMDIEFDATKRRLLKIRCKIRK